MNLPLNPLLLVFYVFLQTFTNAESYIYGSENPILENSIFNLFKMYSSHITINNASVSQLSTLYKAFKELGNVTVVGWQNVYDSDGNLEQVNTIELTGILQGNRTEYISYHEYDDYPANRPELRLLQLKNDLLNNNGIPFSGSVQSYQGGYLAYLLMVHQNQDLFSWNNRIVYGLRNFTAPISQVDKFARQLKKELYLPMLKLRWNAYHEFYKGYSIYRDGLGLIGSVTDEDNATPDMTASASDGLVLAHLLDPDNVLQFLSKYMVEHNPGYRWHVGSPRAYFNSPIDVRIELAYENVPIGQNRLVYAVYGVNDTERSAPIK